MLIRVLWNSALPWRVRWATLLFSRHRSDYYRYVAACLAAQARHRSLLDFLQLDAMRRVDGGCRSILAQWWAHRFLLSGASLTETLRGTLPSADIACLELARRAGQHALQEMLLALAQQRSKLDDCRLYFLQTVAAGVVALFVVLLVATVLPVYAVPKLQQVFAMVKPEHYGPQTRALCIWVDIVLQWGWLWLSFCAMCIGLLQWSLAHWISPLRNRLDGIWVWRWWRDLQAVSFLTLTATLVQALALKGVSLRTILQMQMAFSNPYQQYHLLRMLLAMDQGVDPVEAMRTGMIDKECWWYLQDTIYGHGLTVGFTRGGERVLTLLVRRVEQQAIVWRVVLLGGAVFGALYMGYWHACVIEEMRQGVLLNTAIF